MSELQINPQIVAIDMALAEAKSIEILCDSEAHRLNEVTTYIERVTPHLKNPKVSLGMKTLAQKAIDQMKADAGIEMMAQRKIHLINYQVSLTNQKIQLIADSQTIKAIK